MNLAGACFQIRMVQGMKWRDLFDMVIVMARKPDFFNYNMSL